jgi:hypothetical protein
MKIFDAFLTMGIFYDHLVHFLFIWYIFLIIWYIFPGFGIMHHEKSGNPGEKAQASSKARRKA